MFRPAPWLALHRELGLDPPPPFDDRPLAAFVAARARSAPQAPAIRFDTHTIDYATLDALGARFAAVLAGLGVGRGDVVGLHMPNVPQYLVALVGISRLGAAGCGVSPLLAPAELVWQIDNARIRVLISLDSLANAVLARAAAFPDSLRTVIVTSAEELFGAPAPNPPALHRVQVLGWSAALGHASGAAPAVADIDPHDPFMIQYTGGTTGQPKGALLSTRNLFYNPLQVEAYAPWTDDETVLTPFPLFHTAGLAMHLWGLRSGAEVVMIPDPRDLDFLVGQFARRRPTRICCVPALYQMLLARPDFVSLDHSRIKIAFTGGAPITAEVRRQLDTVLGPGRLSDVFGMTETGPVHVCHPPMRPKPGTVGIPVSGTDTRIVDLETGAREMPFGEPGEIITSGPQVMLGYLDLPDETALALRKLDGRTWMFTGDVGFMDEEGYITLCDRAKDMLVVGGYKVFSVEVEDKLKAVPGIAQSAIIGTPDAARPGNDVVNLCVERTPEFRAEDEDALRARIIAFCRENMAAYKVPKRIHIVEPLPLTVIGKIDKKALRARLQAARN